MWILIFLCSFFVRTVFSQESAKKPAADLTEMALEDLMKIKVDTVYAASKRLQKVTEAPSLITVVSSVEIKRYGYRNLADVLRSVGGFYITNARDYSYVGVRGFSRPGDYNNRILVLIDGHRINYNIYDAALVGNEFPLDMELIQRIEIIRGPTSSLYGTSAFFAVINIITRRGESFERGMASAEGGSLGTGRGFLGIGKKWKSGSDLLLAGSFFRSRGNEELYFPEYDSPSTNHGVAENIDRDQYEHFFANLNAGNFTLQGVYSNRRKQLPTGIYETVFNDPRAWTRDVRGYVDLKYERNWEKSRSNLLARVYFDSYDYQGDYPYQPEEEAETVLSIDSADGKWSGAEFKYSRLLANKHMLTAGIDFENSFRQNQMTYDADPFYLYQDTRHHNWKEGTYLQDEWQIHPKLTFNLGIRNDYYSTFGHSTNPRLALIWFPGVHSTIKILYGTAFRAPNGFELYYQDNYQYKGNPDLKPEKIRTYEAIYERSLGASFRLFASGFLNQIDNLIEQEMDPVDGFLVFQNLGDARARGFELGGSGKWKNAVEGRLSYTYQQAVDFSTGEWLSNSPRHMGKFNLLVPFFEKTFWGGLEFQAMSKRTTRQGNLVDPNGIVNFTLSSRKFLNHWEIAVGFYNLFDHEYSDPVSWEFRQDALQQDGLTIRCKLNFIF